MASDKQIEGAAKARAARAKNAADRLASGVQAPPKPQKGNEMTDKEVWVAAFNTAMRNLEIKSPVNLATCLPVADRALELFKARFK